MYINKIDLLRAALNNKGYVYNNVGDFSISIEFPNCKIFMYETIQETIYFKIIDNNKKTVYKKTYKIIDNIFKYGFKKIIN